MRLDDLRPGLRVRGLLPRTTVTLVLVERLDDDTMAVTYRTPDGRTDNRILFGREADALVAVETARPAFDADGAELRLVSEALRIRNAHLFDPYLAVNTSLVEPLPHQIIAVYGTMLPRQPLRFLLADDPGAGKTIMAGLYMRELEARADLGRCLVVCPGALAGQWQDELYDKFHMEFEIVTPQMAESTPGGNPFLRHRLAISRLDQLSRNEEFQELLEHPDLHWDLIVVDEAHKMSAHRYGMNITYTKRYHLGQRLRCLARHFLLLTATPHNGKDDDFHLFMALLDPDRFEGQFTVDPSSEPYRDLMLRRIKEDLVWPDGKPLFPERKAYTVAYELSSAERELYQAVTRYVREEMNRADRLLDEKAKNVVGFALTVLQRRLASSPAAIQRSLKRRRERLEQRLRDLERQIREHGTSTGEEDLRRLARRLEDLEELDELPEQEAYEVEGQLIDRATAAQTQEELGAEIETLRDLEKLARTVLTSETDAKWSQLREILLNRDRMFDARGHRRKLIVFTEHRDTLEYIADRIRALLGQHEAVATIRGGMGRDERRRVQEKFLQDPEVQVLVATDAAGEGVNLQRAHLMINYDLPWNPNRLEQRFGRIHRIGQTEVCHCWNLVAQDTREGDVYLSLFRKLQREADALDGKVFDVLGKAFAETPLRELMIEAIRYGDDPERRKALQGKVHNVAERVATGKLLEEALVHDVLAPAQIEEIRLDLERAAARRLQPHHIQAFFLDAFRRLGGRIQEREPGRFEIRRAPPALRERAQRSHRREPLLSRYERVTFRKDLVRVEGRPLADLLAPGHPLLDHTVDELLDRLDGLLRRGAVLVDENDPGAAPRALVYLEHDVVDGSDSVVSRRLQFTELLPDGTAQDAGPAPYLDYRPATDDERAAAIARLDGDVWSPDALERRATKLAAVALGREHLEEVRRLVQARVERTERAVRERLTAEIAHWDRRAQELREQMNRGGQPRMNWEHAQERAHELERRLEARLAELERERELHARLPVVRGIALVVPAGPLRAGTGPKPAPATFAREREAVERLAVDAVLAAERAAGREPREMPRNNPGYDIESYDPKRKELLFIEVKGRVAGAATVTLTRNEILTALNRPDHWILALVEIEDGRAAQPRYVMRFFDREPGFAETSVNFDLARLVSRSVAPAEIQVGGGP